MQCSCKFILISMESVFSYLHRNVSMRFLMCEPNLSKEKHYIDEADRFYEDALGWLKKEYHIKRKNPPSHIVYFDRLKTEISEFLTQTGYNHCGTFFHTHCPEGRVGNTVLVSCRWWKNEHSSIIFFICICNIIAWLLISIHSICVTRTTVL